MISCMVSYICCNLYDLFDIQTYRNMLSWIELQMVIVIKKPTLLQI
jgi:hypothetical protein